MMGKVWLSISRTHNCYQVNYFKVILDLIGKQLSHTENGNNNDIDYDCVSGVLCGVLMGECLCIFLLYRSKFGDNKSI